MPDVNHPREPNAPPSAPAAAAPPAGARQENERLARAKRQVAAMKGFYIHLAVFALVLIGLFAINAATGGDWWVQWVLLGWGIGVIAHAVAVFGRAPRAVAEWEDRKVRQLADKQ